MAIKEYALNTIYGITTVELTSEEHEALATKAKLKEEQRAIFANAAMILELLDEDEPQAASTIAELAGIDSEKSASWKRAFAALTKAGLVRRHGYGPKTRYTRVELEAAEERAEPLPAPEPWTRHPHQTLFYGGPASGKSNALQSVIKELAPAVKAGTAKLYGIDPKGSELAIYGGRRETEFVGFTPEGRKLTKSAFVPYEVPALFEKVSLGMDDDALAAHAAIIAEVRGLIAARVEALKNKTVRFDPPADLGRRYTPSAEEPVVVLFIEELAALDAELRRRGAEGVVARAALEQILAMGRSLGVYVVAATQTISLGGLGSVLDNFGQVDVFHQSSRFFNDRLLGKGAAEAGFDSTAIPVAHKENGYRSAGIAFERSGDGIRKVRFPYVSDEETAELVRSFQKDADGEEAA